MTLITDLSELKKLCQIISEETYITVDTEFLRDKYYYPKLCLIQVASEKTAFSVDPLADGMDLTPLFEVFQNTNVIKAFHSARQDIEIILNLSGKVPVPLFDTQVAAMVCGFGPAVSYATLVASFTGRHIDKSSRFTDWARRPLSDKQLDYALSDVVYLRDVYKKLKSQLEKTQRESWLVEEMQDLINPSNYQPDLETVWEKLKPKGASRRFLGTLKELAKWRELTAQAVNRPKSFIIKDQVLLEIAAIAPKTADELRGIRGIGHLKQAFEVEILALIEKVNGLPEESLPERRKHKNVAANESLADMLRVLLKATCSQFNVAEKLVATNDDLHRIAVEDNPDIRVFSGWRYEVFGQHARALKRGEIALSVRDGKLEIIRESGA